MGSDVTIMSVTPSSCSKEDDLCNAKEIVRRVKVAAANLGVGPPADDWIESQVHYIEDYYGEDYGFPTEAATKAIKELANREALFTDPVYTGKAFSGLLDHIRTGKIAPGSNVCFIHTGGTGALFAGEELTGPITR